MNFGELGCDQMLSDEFRNVRMISDEMLGINKLGKIEKKASTYLSTGER